MTVRDARRFLSAHTAAFAVALTLVLLIANVIALPAWAKPGNWAGELAAFAPFALVAMASTPAVLSGGVDISIGPLTTFVNVVIVVWLLPSDALGGPVATIAIALALGLALGLLNGVLVAVFRFQSIIATLCLFFILTGACLKVAEAPKSAPAGNWTESLVGSLGPLPGGLLLIAAPVVLWLALRATPYHRALYAVGGDDATAFSAGVDVRMTRVVAYGLGGLIAGLAGVALTALLQSADATLAQQYTLIAFAAVALGGTRVGGGVGGFTGAIFGAASIYLLQTLLTALHVEPTWLQVVYGGLLTFGVLLGARLTVAVTPRGGAA